MATIVEMINPLTGLPEQVDKLDHTAQEIDDAVGLAPQLSNPNLLDNWYFGNPVNQRGQTEYTANYAIDRWWLQYDTTLSVVDGGIKIGGKWDANQYFETTLPNATYTLSLLYKDRTGSDPLRLLTGNRTDGDLAQTESKDASGILSVTFSTDKSNKFSFGFTGSTDNSAIIIAIKLELGDTQTLAHKENEKWVLNEIPDFGEQLARCQRYFVNFNPYKMSYFAMPPAVASTTTQAYSAVTLPVAMRAQPVVSYGGNIALSQNADHAITAILVSDNTFTGNSIQLRYDVGAGTLTANSLYRVQGSNDPTSYIWLSADL